MEIGVFQLLPRGRAASDREVIEQGLWEVDFAERHGFESVWVTEHHFSGFGMVSAPSVYAAAIAQRTKRIRIGYGVAVVPLHHPLRLAEEISWVDHLSEGRVMVGLGPGFSAAEFEGFGVPLEERHARLASGFEIMRRVFVEETIRPHPYTKPHPPFYWASSSGEGLPLLLGLKSVAELVERLDRYREDEIAEMYVLRRICIADTDAEAIREMRDVEEDLTGAICGSVDTVLEQLDELRALGLRKVIGWFHFGNMPHASVRRSMQLMARDVIPAGCRSQTLPVPALTGTGR